MSDKDTRTDTDRPGEREIQVRFSRQLMGGYRRGEVDAWAADCAKQIVELHEQLIEQLEESDKLRTENRQLRGELRHWNERLTYIEGEADRVRAAARRIEADAHARATEIEQNAQHGALQMVDRVCTEANNILMMARDEARELMARQEHQMQDGRERLERMTRLQLDITASMRKAMREFETGLLELEAVEPSRRAEEIHGLPAPRDLPAPTRRAQPTFGRTAAVAAMEAGPADLDLRPSDGGPGDGADRPGLHVVGRSGDAAGTGDFVPSPPSSGTAPTNGRSGRAGRPLAIEHATGDVAEHERARVMAANAAAVMAGRSEPEALPEAD